ncbi:MAG: prolyl oligopeptidase family serine peptidase [Bacteroidaceae bacterium]|nr:prolyl oligopeptidase family serine peptidase [Bacteroidaceae bacterium]
MRNYILPLLSLLISSPVFSQGTKEDYQRAYSLQRNYSAEKIKGNAEEVRWQNSDHFTYLIDGKRHHGSIKADGSVVIDDPADTVRDERRQRYMREQQRRRFTNRRQHQRHWMETDDERNADPILSPDSSLVAFVRNDNIYVAKPDGSNARQLTADGTLSHYYSSYISWSPDSRYVAACRIRPIEKRYVYYVESSPADQLQPILHKQEYAKPGDELMQKTPVIVEVATAHSVTPEPDLIANQYDLSSLEWRKDSRAVRFEYNQRGHKLYRVYEMNVPAASAEASMATTSLTTLIEESFSTYVNYSAYHYRHDFDDGRILWMSERDGYAHLYLYDCSYADETNGKQAKSKKAKKQKTKTQYISTWQGNPLGARQITRGQWVVRRVQHVDEENGIIIFSACGMNKTEDPYNIHYYSIRLDGTGLTDLTPEPANHSAQFNKDFTYLIDTYSTPTQAPVTVLRSVSNANAAKPVAQTLATSDISELQAAGWNAPEPFVAPGRDGKTPIYGLIYRPSNFNPSKSYPVIEYIYSGPGDAYTPKTFSSFNWNMTPLAELGFIVVQLDGMSTSHRGKAFEEVCYKNLKDAGFPDRIAWLKAAAARYPYMDIERMGIFGASAGGQESTTAMLLHGDFYKAAYSSCGCHDNRMDKIWWNEQWMGYPIDSSYVECSNVENAYKLKGKLMLVVGELDDNVDPASTMQVANALIKAGKDFELVVLPGVHHTMGERFGEHKRYDFFVRNLLGVTPPSWESLKY